MADAFSRQKMQWLNSVIYNQNVTSTACRVAYVIADKLNRATHDCWLAHITIARRLGISAKTVQRSLNQLKAYNFLIVRYAGSARRKQRFMPILPDERNGDTFAGKSGQARPQDADASVHQSLLENLDRSFLVNGAADSHQRKANHRRDRGRLEVEVARRLGDDGFDVLSKLATIDDKIVVRLCEAQATNSLSSAHLNAARLAAQQMR